MYALQIQQVRSLRIVFFGIWTWDFMSDLIFTARAFDQDFVVQGWLGLTFVVIPWTSNIVLLIKSQKKWTHDSTIKYQISRWLLRYNKKLIFLTIICGSAFAAVDLCNSRAFGMLNYCICCVYCVSFVKIQIAISTFK